MIDWSARGAAGALPELKPASGVATSKSAWREDFVGALARDEQDRNPNQSLRITLAAVPKAAKLG